MKKLLKFLLIVALVSAGVSCENDDKEGEKPKLSNDCAPTAFVVAGQLGNATIATNSKNNDTGSISITLGVAATNISALSLTTLDLPQGATANIEVGDQLDLSNDYLRFTVTAESGKKRVYTIRYTRASAEKDVLAFAIDKQVGNADIDNAAATITLGVEDSNADTTLDITVLTLPAGATADIAVGGTITFNNYAAMFTVTAADQSTRTYTVTFSYKINDAMTGSYRMLPRLAAETYGGNAVLLEGGTTNSAGWFNLYDKSWLWQQSGDVQCVNDYGITFTATWNTATELGGNVTLTSPGDQFFNAIWSADNTDASAQYHLIPQGTSKWSRARNLSATLGATEADNLVTFYNASDVPIGECYFVLSGTTIESSNTSGTRTNLIVGQDIRVNTNNTGATVYPNYLAFHRQFTGTWSGTNSDKGYYITYLRRVVWCVEKID